MDDEICPHCKHDMRGVPIPTENLRHYYPIGTPTEELRPKFYSRIIGVNHSGVYDGVLYWMCPDCGGTWHRFSPGDWRYDRAEQYITK